MTASDVRAEMAKTKTHIDRKNRIAYTFDRQSETVTAMTFSGEETVEMVSKGLVERLTAQIGPEIASVLLRGSKNLDKVVPAPSLACWGCYPSTDCYGCSGQQ
jgi:hypothetical protein